MPYTGLSDFISDLEKHSELLRINTFTDPVLEITEITDRVSKSGGKALLFINNGTKFPLLINAYGSLNRMAMAISRNSLDDPAGEMISMFDSLSGYKSSLFGKMASLPELIRVSRLLPSRSSSGGRCQQVVMKDPDLSLLPVLKCWPHDGGRFITLPVVHTVNPVTGHTNAGMYRMQILDKNTTAMHWQRHKTGANHFEEWKKAGIRMPVTVTLGGDPVYTYAATAPLPENIDEYILAGFLRRKKVKLVKCLTNNLYIPSDADIVIEGYVDPSEDLVWEGPFGDHTGFYSLADWYPKFHVTCITHARNAIYPATIVGVPPMEDAWLTKATEKIFLAPMKLALQPEIEDFHMPDAGTAHNLVIVRIRKNYPGQGRKVINSLFGAGQMMFTKYLAVTSGDVNIRDYASLLRHILEHVNFSKDLLFSTGPLDVLDHSSDSFSFGGKLGIDATVKVPEEMGNETGTRNTDIAVMANPFLPFVNDLSNEGFRILAPERLPVLIAGLDLRADMDGSDKLKQSLTRKLIAGKGIVLAIDANTDMTDLILVAWQVLGNADPVRDVVLVNDRIMYIDGTMKIFRKSGFPRRWPNVVCSSQETITNIDARWESLEIGQFIKSPSVSIRRLSYSEGDEVPSQR
jgi:4-hydroxy-3-polyprenylbenzoate decarboxylase